MAALKRVIAARASSAAAPTSTSANGGPCF